MATAHSAENIGQATLVPPMTVTCAPDPAGSPKQLVPSQTISTPVYGSASKAMSGTSRRVPGRARWKAGFAKKLLRPPPAPNWKPSSSGGTIGGLPSVWVFTILVRFVPHTVWKRMWLLESSARLVPPTAVPQGESAGVLTP